MIRFTQVFFISLFIPLLVNSAYANEAEIEAKLASYVTKAETLLDKDLKGYKYSECKAIADETLALTTKNYTNETLSLAFFVSGAFEGIIAKASFIKWKPWTIKTTAYHTKLAFPRLKQAIVLDPQNEHAVITHARLTRSGYKHRNIVNRYIKPNINFKQEKKDALFNLDNLVDQSNPKIEKYRKKLKKLK